MKLETVSKSSGICGLGLISLMALVTMACPQPTKRPPDTLVIGVLADIQGWNPYLTETKFSEDVLALIYPSLAIEDVDYHDHPPTFLPSLATSWEESEDGLEILFHLREGVNWSDGTPVTSDDVVFTWQAQTSPEVGWYASYIKDFIQSVEAVDAQTVRFRFSHPYSYQLMDANEGLILPAHLWREIPFVDWASTDWLPRVVAAGPYRPLHHHRQQELALQANEDYDLGPRARIKKIVWRIVPDQMSLFTQLLGGAFDFVNTVPPEESGRITNHPDLQLVDYADRGYTHICWNTSRPPLDDPQVRRALSLAINRQAIVSTVYRSFAKPSVGPILTTMWAFDRSLEPLDFDQGEARRLLAEAGWSDSDGDSIVDREGVNLEIELLTNAENRMRQDICVLAAADLERIGVRAIPRAVEWGTFLSRLQTGDFDGGVNRWIEPTQIDLEDVWHTAPQGVPTSNYGRYSNAEVDLLIDQAAETTDFLDQKPLYDRIQQIIHADQPYTFLVEGRRLNALSSRVRGAELNDATPYFNLAEWELEPSRR